MKRGGDIDGPVRSCVGCGARDAQRSMLRLRVDPAGEPSRDPALRDGRSAYLHARPACVEGLRRSKGLGRSLRRPFGKEVRERLAESIGRELVNGGLAANGADA